MDTTLKAMKAALGTTIQRCHNPNNHQYHLYGGRGIKVCKRWRDSFENFLEDMGVRPEGLTLERENNDKGYSKSNCVWASRQQQSNNTRLAKLVLWRGRKLSMSAWERELGMKPGTLKARLGVLGYTIEQAFTKPVKCGSKVIGRAYPPRKKPDMSNVSRGLNSPLTKLSRSTVRSFQQRHKAGETFSALAREYDVSVTTASNACQGLGAYKGI